MGIIAMMSRLALLLLAGILPLAAADAAPKLVTIEGRVRAPVTSESFRVVVNGGQHTAIVRRDGSFQVPDVAAGAAYLVDVQSTSFMFEPVRVTVQESGDVRANVMYPLKPGHDAAPYPLFLQARGKLGFFEVREGFNFAMLYKNPMVLMMGFSCVMMFMMKYMVDPEEMKKMQAQMAEEGITGPGDMFKKMLKDPQQQVKARPAAA